MYSCLNANLRYKVLHPVIASVCKRFVKLSNNTDKGSRLAERWSGNHFITLAIPGSMPVSLVFVATFNEYSFLLYTYN